MSSVFLYNICQTFLILIRNAQDVTINVQMSLCAVPVFREMLMELGNYR